jgi:hypothetical protein
MDNRIQFNCIFHTLLFYKCLLRLPNSKTVYDVCILNEKQRESGPNPKITISNQKLRMHNP